MPGGWIRRVLPPLGVSHVLLPKGTRRTFDNVVQGRSNLRRRDSTATISSCSADQKPLMSREGSIAKVSVMDKGHLFGCEERSTHVRMSVAEMADP